MVSCDRTNNPITRDQRDLPDARRCDQKAVARIFMASLSHDLGCLERDALVDRYDARFGHFYGIAKPLVWRLVAKVRPPRDTGLLGCDR